MTLCWVCIYLHDGENVGAVELADDLDLQRVLQVGYAWPGPTHADSKSSEKVTRHIIVAIEVAYCMGRGYVCM